MTHREMLSHWPDDHCLAKDMGVAYHRARDWRRRNSIPSTEWAKFTALCEEKGIDGVTLESLIAAQITETA